MQPPTELQHSPSMAAGSSTVGQARLRPLPCLAGFAAALHSLPQHTSSMADGSPQALSALNLLMGLSSRHSAQSSDGHETSSRAASASAATDSACTYPSLELIVCQHSMAVRAFLEDLWQWLLSVATQLLAAGTDAGKPQQHASSAHATACCAPSSNTSASITAATHNSDSAGAHSTGSSGRGLSAAKAEVPASLQHLVHAVQIALCNCDAIGERLAMVQVHVEHATQLLAETALSLDWGARRHLGGNTSHHKVSEQQHGLARSYHQLAQACILGGLHTDTVLLGLSDCYAHARSLLAQAASQATITTFQQQACQQGVGRPAGSPPASAAGPWKPPDQFRRSTTKFWVKLDDVPRLRVALLRHLPVLVFGRPEGKLLLDLAQHLPQHQPVQGQQPSHGLTPTTQLPKTTSPDPSTAECVIGECDTDESPSVTLCDTADSRSSPSPGFSLQERAALATEHSAASTISSVYFDAPRLGVNGATQAASKLPGALQLWPFKKHEPPEADINCQPLPVYHARLRRGDGSALVRVRWYGPPPNTATGQVFLERKLHHDAWTGEFSMKERVPLPLRRLPDLLSGDTSTNLDVAAKPPLHESPQQPAMSPSAANMSLGCTAAAAGHSAASSPAAAAAAGNICEGPAEPAPMKAGSQKLVREIQAFLHNLQQEAVLRTNYKRTAFQRSDTNAVRISLDTQVTLSRERPAPACPWFVAHPPAKEGQTAQSGPPADLLQDVVQFEYAILEVKLQDGDSCPDWVLACRQSGLLVEVPKFSKFLHGMALLYPHLVRNTPSWFLPHPIPTPSHSPSRVTVMPLTPPTPVRTGAAVASSSGPAPELASSNTAGIAASDEQTALDVQTSAEQPAVESAPADSNSSSPNSAASDPTPIRVNGHTSHHASAVPQSHFADCNSGSAAFPQLTSSSLPPRARSISAAQLSAADCAALASTETSRPAGGWSAVKHRLLAGLLGRDGPAGTLTVMKPATIEQAAVEADIYGQGIPDWLFAPDITPEQWFDAQATCELPPGTCTHDPTCPACQLHASTTQPISAAGTATSSMGTSKTLSMAVKHTCALAKTWELATRWRLPGSTADVTQDDILSSPVAGLSGTDVHQGVSAGGCKPAGCATVKGGCSGLGSSEGGAHDVPTGCEITLCPSVPPESACSTPTLRPTSAVVPAHGAATAGVQALPRTSSVNSHTSSKVLLPTAPSRHAHSNSMSSISGASGLSGFSSLASTESGAWTASDASVGSPTAGEMCTATLKQYGFDMQALSHNHTGPASGASSGSQSPACGTSAGSTPRCTAQPFPDTGSTPVSSCYPKRWWCFQKPEFVPASHDSISFPSFSMGDTGRLCRVEVASAAVTAPQPAADALLHQAAPHTSTFSVTHSALTGTTGSLCHTIMAHPPSSPNEHDAADHTKAAPCNNHFAKNVMGMTGSPETGSTSSGSDDNHHKAATPVWKRAARRVAAAMRGWRGRQGAGRTRGPASGRAALDEEQGALLPTAPHMIRSRIEPKTFFAAERTFLSWLNLSVLLMFVALSLLATAMSYAARTSSPTSINTPDTATAVGPGRTTPQGAAKVLGEMSSGPAAWNNVQGSTILAAVNMAGAGVATQGLPGPQVTATTSQAGLFGLCGASGAACKAGLVSGLIVAPTAMLFMAYALFMYRHRTAQILRRETVRYDDQRGPVVLVLLLLLVLAVAYGLTVKLLVQ